MKKIIKTIKTNKGSYYIIEDELNNKSFKKQIKNGILNEIEGYNFIKYYYNVPKLLEYNIVDKEITYEFNDDLFYNTMHQGLFGDSPFNQNKIINVLTSNFRNFKFQNENISKNSIFFLGRISNISEYLTQSDKDFEKDIIYNGENLGTFKNCVKTIIYSLTQNNIVPFIISQGDPTDLNISINGTITDFETAGDNSLINEIAIFLGCYLVNCYYYYIKYMNSPHKQYTETLEKYKNLVRCDFIETEKSLEINFSKLLPDKVKNFILAYLKQVKDLEIINSGFKLGPYVAMRMITPVDITNVSDKSDRYLLFALTALFTKKYVTLADIIKFIRGI